MLQMTREYVDSAGLGFRNFRSVDLLPCNV